LPADNSCVGGLPMFGLVQSLLTSQSSVSMVTCPLHH